MPKSWTLALLALTGCAPEIAPFPPDSPAAASGPDGHRVPVATVLEAREPGDAARSPLLGAPGAAPAVDHSHHHGHHGMPAASSSAAAPAAAHSHHPGSSSGGEKP